MQLKTQEQHFKETLEQKIQLKYTYTRTHTQKTQYNYFKELTAVEMNKQ